MRVTYAPQDAKFWLEYLEAEQTGAGFVGLPYQRGAGIGSFFRSLFRMASPVLKRAAKAVGKQALITGANVIGDVVKGGDFLPALETHGKAAASALAERTSKRLQEAKQWSDLGVEDQQGSGLGKRKFSARAMAINHQPKAKKRRTAHRHSDIFG